MSFLRRCIVRATGSVCSLMPNHTSSFGGASIQILRGNKGEVDWKVIGILGLLAVLAIAIIRDPKMIYHFVGWIDQLVSKVGTIGAK